MGKSHQDPQAGANNLLVNCIGVKPGETVLIIREREGIDYYDEGVPELVGQAAGDMGANVTTVCEPMLKGPEHVPDEISRGIQRADHTIFFSRIGDQIRFSKLEGGGTKTMRYALNLEYLGSEFCTVLHGLMDRILAKLEAEIDVAREWHITCPLGTDVRGEHDFEPPEPGTKSGFSLLNFPIGTFRPLSCKTMNGRVVVSRWLTPSGSHLYEPDHLIIDNPIAAIVKDGRITGFDGDSETVRKVEKHYHTVAGQLDINPDIVHSWHAGINGQTYYSDPPTENLWRWANLTFSSPRRLHFHTCGDYPPGEIAWSIYDQSVYFDSVLYWKDGRFVYLDREDLHALLDEFPTGAKALQMRTDIGV